MLGTKSARAVPDEYAQRSAASLSSYCWSITREANKAGEVVVGTAAPCCGKHHNAALEGDTFILTPALHVQLHIYLNRTVGGSEKERLNIWGREVGKDMHIRAYSKQ